MSHDPDGDAKVQAMRREVLADLRRWLIRRELIGTAPPGEQAVIEAFIADYEHARGLR